MKISELLAISDSGVLSRFAALPMPAGHAFKLARWKKKIEPELLSAVEARLKAAEKYGSEVDDRIQIPKDKLAEYEAEMEPVLNHDVEAPPRIEIDEIGGKLSAADAEKVLPFIAHCD